MCRKKKFNTRRIKKGTNNKQRNKQKRHRCLWKVAYTCERNRSIFTFFFIIRFDEHFSNSNGLFQVLPQWKQIDLARYSMNLCVVWSAALFYLHAQIIQMKWSNSILAILTNFFLTNFHAQTLTRRIQTWTNQNEPIIQLNWWQTKILIYSISLAAQMKIVVTYTSNLSYIHDAYVRKHHLSTQQTSSNCFTSTVE